MSQGCVGVMIVRVALGGADGFVTAIVRWEQKPNANRAKLPGDNARNRPQRLKEANVTRMPAARGMRIMMQA